MDDSDDSLFEGMILFNPLSSPPSTSSQFPPPQIPPQSPVTNNNINNSHDDSIELSTPTAGATNEPLDENLFSDLTLIHPPSLNTNTEDDNDKDDVVSSSLDPPPPLSPSSSSTSSRSTTEFAIATATSAAVTNSVGGTNGGGNRSLLTSSTRKKKRAGLRIGYGRGAGGGDGDHSQQPQFDVSAESPSGSLGRIVSQEKVDPEEEKQKIELRTGSVIGSELTVGKAVSLVMEERVEVNGVVGNSDSTLECKVQEEPEVIEEVTEVESRESTIELRYEQVKKEVGDKLNCAQQAVALVSGKRKEVVRKRRKAAEELSLADGKYKEMEKELEEAVETEDFETAERVSDSLASAERNKELLSIALREAEAECDGIDSKMQEALELQIVAEEECAALLKSFAVDADHSAESVISNVKAKTSEELENWVSLYEALEVKKMEAEIESDVLSGARQGLDDSIDGIVKEDKQECDLLHTKKKILADELQELLALVKQKEAEIAENNSQIEEIEKKMAGAVSSFQDVLSDIELKSEKLQSGLSQLELENDDLSKKKKEIDDFALQEEGRGLKIRELGRVSADEAGVYEEVINLRKSLIKFISKSREYKIRLATTEQKLFDDVQTLKQDISAVRASLQDLSSTKSGTQQSIESSKQRLLFIEKRVPEIESEKRVFATARNFKEAARIANEAKTLYVEKETLQLKIDEQMTTLKKIEDDINQNVGKLQEKEENVSLMEKELETVRYQRLVLLARAATAERSAAIALGDIEEADILLNEAQAADLEAKKIQPSFENEEFDSFSNTFISMELVSTLDKNKLAELAASTQISAA